jgi:hypothetical protein
VSVRGVEIVGLHRFESEHLSQRGGRALAIQRAGRGELRVRSEYTRGDERHGPIALGAATSGEKAIEAELLEGAEHGRGSMVNASSGATTVSPRRTRRSPSMVASERWDRLARVRFLTRPPSR